MFTGLVEEKGVVEFIRHENGGLRITVKASEVMNGLKIDDSVAINGVCQTVVEHSSQTFTVQAIPETVNNTTFKSLKQGQYVNLERAMPADGRFGGHIVQGHVDGVGVIRRVSFTGNSTEYYIGVDKDIDRYIVKKGSVCLDGISLTVTDISNSILKVSIIPHTMKNTCIDGWQPNVNVNIETDILARYIEKFMTVDSSGLTIDKLKEFGF